MSCRLGHVRPSYPLCNRPSPARASSWFYMPIKNADQYHLVRKSKEGPAPYSSLGVLDRGKKKCKEVSRRKLRG